MPDMSGKQKKGRGRRKRPHPSTSSAPAPTYGWLLYGYLRSGLHYKSEIILQGRNITMTSRIPPLIQPLLDAYLHALEPLYAHIYGIYIYGSIALGAFEEQESDIDMVVLTQGEWTDQEFRHLRRIHKRLVKEFVLGKRLAPIYVPLDDIGKLNADIAPYPYASD